MLTTLPTAQQQGAVQCVEHEAKLKEAAVSQAHTQHLLEAQIDDTEQSTASSGAKNANSSVKHLILFQAPEALQMSSPQGSC